MDFIINFQEAKEQLQAALSLAIIALPLFSLFVFGLMQLAKSKAR